MLFFLFSSSSSRLTYFSLTIKLVSYDRIFTHSKDEKKYSSKERLLFDDQLRHYLHLDHNEHMTIMKMKVSRKFEEIFFCQCLIGDTHRLIIGNNGQRLCELLSLTLTYLKIVWREEEEKRGKISNSSNNNNIDDDVLLQYIVVPVSCHFFFSFCSSDPSLFAKIAFARGELWKNETVNEIEDTWGFRMRYNKCGKVV